MSENLDRNLLIGVWKLDAYRIYSVDSLDSLKLDLVGRLTYTDTGHVFVVITRAPEETVRLADVIAYSGKYEMISQQVRHSIYVSSIASYVGSDQLRDVAFEDNCLVLKTVGRADGSTHVARWSRV